VGFDEREINCFHPPGSAILSFIFSIPIPYGTQKRRNNIVRLIPHLESTSADFGTIAASDDSWLSVPRTRRQKGIKLLSFFF